MENLQERFISYIVARAFTGVKEEMQAILTDPADDVREQFGALRAFYARLAPDERRLVDEIVTETAVAAVFGVLCVIDNVVIGALPTEDFSQDRLSDYRLVIEKSERDVASGHYTRVDTLPISGDKLEMLHDAFLNAIDY